MKLIIKYAEITCSRNKTALLLREVSDNEELAKDHMLVTRRGGGGVAEKRRQASREEGW